MRVRRLQIAAFGEVLVSGNGDTVCSSEDDRSGMDNRSEEGKAKKRVHSIGENEILAQTRPLYVREKASHGQLLFQSRRDRTPPQASSEHPYRPTLHCSQ